LAANKKISNIKLHMFRVSDLNNQIFVTKNFLHLFITGILNLFSFVCSKIVSLNWKRKNKKKNLISFGFQCPFHIISPRLDTGQFKNDIFQMRPEVYQLQWVIQPADSDAEVCVMWRHMVYAMMYSRHYNMKVLKDCYVPRQTEISVTPLVDLI
jgi:hypothetical protein